MKAYRLVLWVTILASLVAFLDGSIVNVALPAIAYDLGGGLVTEQWVVDAYAITLGALMLLAGSLSDLFGRKRILMIGLVGFGMTSLLCALATTDIALFIGRALQGVAGALLVPSSLAIIISQLPKSEQAHAIGRWTSWTSVGFLIGPFVGGLLVDAGSWRYVFFLNLPIIAITIWLASHLNIKESRPPKTRLDITGLILSATGLGGLVFALIEQSHLGWKNPLIITLLLIGIAALTILIYYEKRHPDPMLPLQLFRVRNFTAGNLATVFIYAGLSLASFLIIIFVQQVGKYSASFAGLTMIPESILMITLASRFGKLSGQYGPRLFMTLGPLIAALGFFSMNFVGASANYWSLLPGIILFGIGLAITVAPLTAAVLGDINSSQSGIASSVNNAISRIAGLIAVALVGVIVSRDIDLQGFHQGVTAIAVLLLIGSLVSYAGIRNKTMDISAATLGKVRQ